MPLILMSGYPKSGKTHRSKQILTHFESLIATHPHDARLQKIKLVHISDDTLGLARTSYATARDEKLARAAFSSAIERAVDGNTIVVADGMNYIKGFRYQMYCEAKAVRTPSCVIHVGTPPPICLSRNQACEDESSSGHMDRSPGPDESSSAVSTSAPPYPADVFDNLIQRYEEPNGMSRWDSPLFTVIDEDPHPPYAAIITALLPWLRQTSSVTLQSTSLASTTDATSAASAVSVSGDQRRQQQTQAQAQAAEARVRPNLATVLQPATSADLLRILDKATNGVIEQITAAIAPGSADGIGRTSDAGGGVQVSIPGVSDPVCVPETMPNGGTVSRAVLLRLKRQFMALNRGHRVAEDADGVRRLFVGYLNDEFED